MVSLAREFSNQEISRNPVQLKTRNISSRNLEIKLSFSIKSGLKKVRHLAFLFVILIDKLHSIHSTSFIKCLKNKVHDRRNVSFIYLVKYLHNPAITNDNRNNFLKQEFSKIALIRYTEILYSRLFLYNLFSTF